MNITIELTQDEIKESVSNAVDRLIYGTYRKEIEKSLTEFLINKEILHSMIRETSLSIVEKQIFNMMKTNDQSVIQMMREELSKLLEKSLPAPSLSEILTQDEISHIMSVTMKDLFDYFESYNFVIDEGKFNYEKYQEKLNRAITRGLVVTNSQKEQYIWLNRKWDEEN